MAVDYSNFVAPICVRHEERMILSFYHRPGSPDGNGYVCQSCVKERKEAEQTKKDYANTRWPEGAEI